MDPLPTRARLLDAAAAVFLAHGFAAASMDLVRQQAGVSNGSLYHHFPTKAHLADALYAQVLREFHADLMRPVAGRASAQTAVKGLVRAYMDWVVAHPGNARLLHELKRQGSLAGGTGEWEAANAEGFGALQAWVARRVEAGELRPMPFPAWMAVVFAPVMQLTPFWLTQPEPHVPPKVRAALEHAAWAGVRPD
jgi:AcrR family transcriptional regulator